MAEINEIISKEAIQGIKDADKAITDFDTKIASLIAGVKGLTTSIGGENSTLKDVNKAMNEAIDLNKKSNELQKEAIKVKEKTSAADRKAAADLEKAAKKQAEFTEALKLQVKSIEDATRQNKALTEARKKLDLTTEQGRKSLTEYNSTINKNTEFIRANGSEADKQRMNIGNYKSALGGLVSMFTVSTAAVIGFGVAAFKAFEDQEKANRKLLFSLNNNKNAYEQLTAQANELQSKTGVADDAIQGVQVLGAESGKTTEEIKKITEATVNWAALTGQDLQAAYLQINATLGGTAGRLTRVDAEFGKLTETQLKSGAAIDLINEKFKGFAENAASETEKLSANWDEFKEAAGGAIANGLNPALQATSNLLTEINTKQSFWQKLLTTAANFIPGTQLSGSLDARNLKNNNVGKYKGKLDNEAIRNAESTKILIEKTKAEKLAAYYSEVAANKKEENVKKTTKAVEKETKALKEISLLVSANTEMEFNATQQKILENKAREVAVKLIEDEEAALLALSDAQVAAGIEKTMGGKISGALKKVRTENEKKEANKDFAIEAAQSTADATFTIIRNADQALFDAKMNDLEREKEEKLKNTKLTADQKAKIEDEYAKKTAKLRTEQAKKEKAANVIEAVIQGALSVLKAPPGLKAITALQSALLVGTIIAQPIPKFDSGSLSTPDTFIAGEKRPEWMISPSGSVSLVSKPTLFKGMAGSTIIGGADTERIMNATSNTAKSEALAPFISKMEQNVVNAIKNKSELHISASGARITERSGDWNKEYFNRKIQWQRKAN